MKDFLISLFQNEAFLGALLGAVITGILALYINGFQHRKQSQKEDYESKKVLKIFHHYSKEMITHFNNLSNNYNKFDAIYDPHSQIEIFEDEHGQEHLVYYPQDFEIKEYEIVVKPFIDIIKRESESLLNEFEKVNAINIYSLKLKELDNVLKFLSIFRSSISPKLKEVIKTKRPTITSQERDTINRIFEAFHNTTKVK